MALEPGDRFVIVNGIAVPVAVIQEMRQRALPPQLENVGAYITYEEFSGHQISEAEIVELLKLLSVEDCIAHIAGLSTRMEASSRPSVDPSLQRQLVQEVIGAESVQARLFELLEDDKPRVLFFEQQLVHLARLVFLHAEDRPHDGFADFKLYNEWMTCLLGVTDLLDAGLKVENDTERLSWELRQAGINHHDDQLPIVAAHHEVFRETWPQMNQAEISEVDEAFKRHSGMALTDFWTLGTAVQARLLNRGKSEEGIAAVPASYLESTKLSEEEWQPFFDLVSRDAGSMRKELQAEDAKYGPTTYGSLTFERFPLLKAEGGSFYVPISMVAFKRRITDGVFHFLAEAAEAEGRDRRAYSSAFGMPFQKMVEGSLRRGAEFVPGAIAVFADQPYRAGGQKRQSSDVILIHPSHAVFIEVVSGPPRAGTTTRGHLPDFELDLNRLVLGKAKQLATSIDDFFSGELALEGIDHATIQRVFPVIVTSHGFPHAETVGEHVEDKLGKGDLLTGERVGDLAVVSVEELCFCEGFAQQGKSFLSLVRGWKTDRGRRQPFKNYLIKLGGGQAPGSDHAELQFAKASADYQRRLFGKDYEPEEILERLREPESESEDA